ncbi:arylamine N-acetyltransferase 1 [Lindgomyces ingoldianus]|uniref:Arylamine N-acetyltransferase 1 n=1 Tax=Lindgomyces ingoldianus TaxID=673940 RepID=A0ACB6QF31_9PLEO|nr:arylamine N-acetyltransferase 1 [Lindgomyces ingoldianus]KAF2465519.1 arylamine N-acetyltransferase 1 [Lindgomyces ingoldianus]
MASTQRPVLGKDQITQYFERIKLPEEHRKYRVAGMRPEETLEYLALLQKHHLVEVPFENLTLHYSHHRQISIHPEELFKKIVEDDNGRGGYCMENNGLFHILLYSLGFNIYSAGGRVYEGSVWSGWAHMVNIVTIGESRYHVDVGFGANGPVRPLKLDRSGAIHKHMQPAAMRLQWRNLNENTDQNQRLWVYEHRVDEKSDFVPTYCFTELEFLPSDYALMNYFTSTNQKTFFTQTIVGEKKILGGENNDELVGSLILEQKNLKWRIYGKKEREIQFETEQDRVSALEEHFGIKLGQVERDSIRGLTSEIKS